MRANLIFLIALVLISFALNMTSEKKTKLREKDITQSKCWTPCGKHGGMCSWCHQKYNKNLCCEGGFCSAFTSYCANTC